LVSAIYFGHWSVSLFAVGACLLGGSTVGCRRAPNQGSSSRVIALTVNGAPRAAASAATRDALPPLSNVAWIEPLPMADGNLAYVTPPVGIREPRPLMVAVHGAGDRPEWACGGWRLGTSEYPFVVCPQGLKYDSQRFAWDAPGTIARRVQGAIDAARARFGPYIADGPTVYAGFSQGATMAGSALLEQRDRFPAVALAEGGYNLLRDQTFLQKLRAAGTTRLMIVCGSPACFVTARSVQGGLSQAGIETFTAGDPLSGHNLNQRMQLALRQALPQLTSGLPNWRGYPRYLATHATNTAAVGE
jgi:predicted esterase